MKVVQISSYGHSDELQIQNVEQPQITPKQVLVQIYDAGVNPIDWKIREGFMKEVMPVKFPYILGNDFAGEVIAAGSEVQKFKRGDRVFGFAHGAYAEFAAVSEHQITLIPESIEYAQAAALPTPGLTAYQIVNEQLNLKPGQSVLIHGAAGGVGALAVQLAKWKGAKIIAVASAKDFPHLKALGVSQMLDYRTEKFEEKVSEVDAVIDLVGGDTIKRSLSVLKKNGILVTTVGPVDSKAAEDSQVKVVQFIMKQRAGDLEQLARLLASKVLQAKVSEVFPLSQAREAQDLNQRGQSHGKIVLQVT